MEDVMTRVERGAEWLDREQPGWLDIIDANHLELDNCLRCVLGQIFGLFEFGIRRAGHAVKFGWYAPCQIWSVAHGFERDGLVANALNVSPNVQYEELATFWKSYILARRASQKLSAPQPQHQDEGELIHA